MTKELLEKTSESTYVLPKHDGMHVPGKLFVNEKLLAHVDEVAVTQVRNAATLPGCVGHSLGMPDMHMGYGFTVGGVAAYSTEDGIISPGAVGFDINCIAAGSEILTRDGYFRPVEAFEDVPSARLRCFDDQSISAADADTLLFMKKPSDKQMFRLRTKTGRELLVSEDHPVFTPDQMKLPEELKVGSRVAVMPFEGVEFEQPSQVAICSRERIRFAVSERRFHSICRELQQRKLLDISAADARVPALIRLLAYSMADGNLTLTEKTKCASFVGTPDDLETIREDIFSLGFTPSRVYSRTRDHRIVTKYDAVEFTSTEHMVKVGSSSFVALLAALGAPVGDKAKQTYSIPSWIRNGTLWHKRLFLASYFGAELSAPATMKGLKGTFYMPVVSMNKQESLIGSASEFLSQIQSLLTDFSVTSTVLKPDFEYELVDGSKSLRVRLAVNQDSWNLIKFFARVGFEYNQEKQFLGCVATEYLWGKLGCVEKRNRIAQEVFASYACGDSISVLKQRYAGSVNTRFIERSAYTPRKSSCRVPEDFVDFDAFASQATSGLGRSGFVWDELVSIEQVEYDGFVYDFTMNHHSHNFVANSLLISNCGVRVLATDLTVDQLGPRIEMLLELLARQVPAGVGKKSSLRLSHDQLDEVFEKGAVWALENGYASEDDIARTEEGGRFEHPDASKISDRAKKRGLSQLGTLGAGNHFLEIQAVDEIFDEKTAEAFGFSKPGQVCVMIHCGSRGVGHQVCTDYLRRIEKELPDLMASLPEKNLAYAPADSSIGKDYFGAMQAAANFAFCNRQIITHHVRKAFK